jgi:hypothetical protein
MLQRAFVKLGLAADGEGRWFKVLPTGAKGADAMPDTPSREFQARPFGGLDAIGVPELFPFGWDDDKALSSLTAEVSAEPSGIGVALAGAAAAELAGSDSE